MVVAKLSWSIHRMRQHFKILMAAFLLFIINFNYMSSNTDHGSYTTRRRSYYIDNTIVRKFLELHQFQKSSFDTFHGNDSLGEIAKQKRVLALIAEENSKRIKEAHEMRGANSNDWILCSKSKNINVRHWPTIGNGHLATVVRSNTVFMNGLYNGHSMETHRARIPAFISLLFGGASLPVQDEDYCLNMQTGIYTETIKGHNWTLKTSTYAHRQYTRLLVTEIVLQTKTTKGIKVEFEPNHGPSSSDMNLTEVKSEFAISRYFHGTIIDPESAFMQKTPVHIYYSNFSANFDVPKDVKNTYKKIYFMTVSPFVDEAKTSFQRGLDMYKAGTLETSHKEAWQKVWDAGRIDISGNSYLAKTAHSTLYSLLTSIPTVDEVSWPFVGMSPGDLAHGAKGKDYRGHVFWDQDTWMYPPILVLNADLGKTFVQTRLRTLDSAYTNAELRGLEGAMYPCESAFEGFDVDPSPPTSIYEIHTTGDVAFGFQRYLMMTRDRDFLRSSRLKEAIGAMADFWGARVWYNKAKDRYEILDVMSPDEWHWPVNNSVYTNELVKMSLLLPDYAYSLVGERAPKKYANIAEKMFIIENMTGKFHPEYEGYNLSLPVKQADVVLLGFPLNMPMSKEYRLNDLTKYEKVTPGGPAMTWGMFAIGWIEMGQPEKAESLFERQLLNQQQPFHVWTEDANGEGAINFITGQGGFLQSIIFGYAGLRITEWHIEIKCTSIPNTDSFTLKNMDYLGNSFDILCGISKTEVTLNIAGKTPLILRVVHSGEMYALRIGNTVGVPNEKLFITGGETS